MKNLIIGDIHGFHRQLRDFLTDLEVIDEKGNRINRDQFNVYSVGDLIDGDYNRNGDLNNLEYASEWFDAVCLGNHEYAFLGGKEFGGRRKHDRKTTRLLLNLIDKKVYVPSILVGDTLITHAGLSEKFPFASAVDAHEYIRIMWELKPDLDEDVMIFDSISSSYSYGQQAGPSIFQLDWTDKRNEKFPQVVGHSTYYTGPIYREYDGDITHWNVDVGAKTGVCVGGISIDDETNEIQALFHGNRNADGFTKQKKTYPPKGDVMAYDPKAQESKSASTTTNQNSMKNGQSTPKSTSSTPLSSKSTSTLDGSKALVKVNNDDLSDLDIALIKDPHILEVYRNEIKLGNSDIELADLVGDAIE